MEDRRTAGLARFRRECMKRPKFSKFVSWNVKIQRFHGLARMRIDMGLTTDLLLSNYNPIDISFKQFISGASNKVQ